VSKASTKSSAWLTPRQAAAMIGWTDKNATERLTRAIRNAERASGFKVLQVVPIRHRSRLMITMAGLRKVLPNLFVTSAEHLPAAINEQFDEVTNTANALAARVGAHGSALRKISQQLATLEALVRRLQDNGLRVIQGGMR
jgi:cobalamin biosynthesis Mg chelatase CobN